MTDLRPSLNLNPNVPADAQRNPPRRRILVVDDMRLSADMVSRLLILLGQRVRTTNDAQSALLALKEGEYDVLFSDIAMPEMNGYELAAEVRRLPERASLILVALTGHGQAGDVRRARESGFDYHLVKPVGIDQLRDFLNELPPLPTEAERPAPTSSPDAGSA